jgi:hypothetical protein
MRYLVVILEVTTTYIVIAQQNVYEDMHVGKRFTRRCKGLDSFVVMKGERRVVRLTFPLL